jgi:hypothetical protein
MTSHVGRLYALALTVLVFFVTWALVSARPWASTQTTQDPRLQALAARERQLRAEAKRVERIVERRWAAYRRRLAVRKHAIAAARRAAAQAPAVRVVTLPPVTQTRSS